jgi:hypothetical protein
MLGRLVDPDDQTFGPMTQLPTGGAGAFPVGRHLQPAFYAKSIKPRRHKVCV